MAYLTGFDRSQVSLFPVSVEQAVAQDSEVRIIELFVDGLPLEELGFPVTANSSDGRPAYHPSDLLKLYVYGYLNRIRTSRLLERECKRNVELMWLLKGLQPCFRTIAGFRSEHPEAFRNAFSFFVRRIGKAGLIGGKTVAIDSSKFRAVNSKKNNYNQRKIDRQIEYIDNKVQQYIQELNQLDAEDEQSGELREKIKKKRQQKRNYKRLEKQLKQSGQDQISTTDSDARSMILHGSVIEVAYNVQTAVDDKNKLIVDYAPTNENDRKALLKTALNAKAACGKDKLTVLADKGYHNAQQIDQCEKENIKTYVAAQDVPRSSHVPTPQYYGERFVYNKRHDNYRCPEGKLLKSNGTWYNKRYKEHVFKVKHYKTSACKGCAFKSQCTTSKAGRLIERSEYAQAVEKNNKRIKTEFPIYQKRQQIIEHIFGTIKRQWGFDHILLKGLKKNDGEFGLIYLIYNFRRVINILGITKAKMWIKHMIFLFLTIRQSIVRGITKEKFRKLRLTGTANQDKGIIDGGFCTN